MIKAMHHPGLQKAIIIRWDIRSGCPFVSSLIPILNQTLINLYGDGPLFEKTPQKLS